MDGITSWMANEILLNLVDAKERKDVAGWMRALLAQAFLKDPSHSSSSPSLALPRPTKYAPNS